MTDTAQRIGPPPLLLAAALLFWGWRTGLLAFAVAMALVVEGVRYVSSRWALSDKDFIRLVDLTSVVLIAITVYLYATRSIYGVFVIVQWLPIVLLLIVAAQMYSTRGSLPLSALFLTLRRRKSSLVEAEPVPRIDVRFPYLVICVLGASAVGAPTPWFYLGLCAVAGWALWSVRPQRSAPVLWGALLAVAIGLGYVGQLGLNRLQEVVGDLAVEWLVNRSWNDRDPYRATTAIGHIGRLKLSDRIELRVKLPAGAPGGLLLRQASYNNYASGIWRVLGDKFAPVADTPPPGTWQLGEPVVAGETATISGYLRRGRGLLALPGGTYRIEDLPAELLKRNPYGAIKVENGPAVVSYTARFRRPSAVDAPPGERDLHVPGRYAPVLGQVVAELGLSSARSEAALAALGKHFAENFRYTLVQRDAKYASLADFLLHTRAGHCEYFATATALLLRAAGIPSRYATGYAVDEYSELEDAYVVRRRHAHSWALAYIDGAWRDVDFTPASWPALEKETAPWWEELYDLGSRIAFLFSRWRSSEGDRGALQVFVWLLIPIGLVLAWRLYFKERVKQARTKRDGRRATLTGPGSDSVFYRIVSHLERAGLPRRPGETLSQWIWRVAADDGDAASKESLRAALVLHYRYRFDPAGLPSEQAQALRSRVTEWLAQQGR